MGGGCCCNGAIQNGLRAALEATSAVHTSVAVDQFLVGPQDVLRFVAPTIEPRASNLFGRLRIGIAGYVDRLAAQIHARRLRFDSRIIKGAFVTHVILSVLNEIGLLRLRLGRFIEHRAIQSTCLVAGSFQNGAFDGNLCELDLVFILR